MHGLHSPPPPAPAVVIPCRAMARRPGLALVAWLLLPGCGEGASDPPPTVFGGDRLVTLQVPATYDSDRSYPLLLVLHGWGGTSLLNQVCLRADPPSRGA